MSAKQAINDKLQGSVATYLRCGGVINNQIKRFTAESVSEKKLNRRIFGKQIFTSKNVVYTRALFAPSHHTAKRRIHGLRKFESAEVTFNVIPGHHRPR